MEDILAQGTDKAEHVRFPDSQQHYVQCVCSDQFSVIVVRVDMIHLTHQGSIDSMEHRNLIIMIISVEKP